MKDFAGDLYLSLTDMVVIRTLCSRGETDLTHLARCAQRPQDYMEISLRDLTKRNITQKRRDKYDLTETITQQMGRYDDQHQLHLPGFTDND